MNFIKNALRNIYNFLPFSFKIFFKDAFFYVYSSVRGAKNINSVYIVRDKTEVCVLGNGPSLNKDKLVLKNIANTHDFVCVNNFCDDDLYIEFKPKLYVFLDPYFFDNRAHPDWVKRRNKTFSIIEKKTTWPMKVILPYSADVSILKKVISNKNIEILKINTQNIYTNKYDSVTGFFFDLGVYGPAQVNVLVYGIYIAILAGYNTINIFGADLSFHNDVNVDQVTNDLFIRLRHFNERDKIEILRKNPSKLEKFTMAELLEQSANTFYAHEMIQKYAESKKIKIYNCSSFSLIDAYERRTM